MATKKKPSKKDLPIEPVEAVQGLLDLPPMPIGAEVLPPEGDGQGEGDESDWLREGMLVLDHYDDVAVKDDTTSMEFPVYALTKRASTEIRSYVRGNRTLRVIPSMVGAATIFDKDLIMYCLSHIVRKINEKAPVSPVVKVNVGPFLVATNRSTGGAAYERVIDMCRRLRGTTIETNIKTTEAERTKGFGLLENYEVTQWTKNGKGALQIKLILPQWIMRMAQNFDVLTLNPAYYELDQALERRLYEIARKHCGSDAWFEISLPLLKEKTGSTTTLRKFRVELNHISEKDSLPEYWLIIDTSAKPARAVFFSRDNAKVMKAATHHGRVAWLDFLLKKRIEQQQKKNKKSDPKAAPAKRSRKAKSTSAQGEMLDSAA